MGYHIDYLKVPPVIRKDGGTGAWREAKKLLRQWYLEQAAKLRDVDEKSYFKVIAAPRIGDDNTYIDIETV